MKSFTVLMDSFYSVSKGCLDYVQANNVWVAVGLYDFGQVKVFSISGVASQFTTGSLLEDSVVKDILMKDSKVE